MDVNRVAARAVGRWSCACHSVKTVVMSARWIESSVSLTYGLHYALKRYKTPIDQSTIRLVWGEVRCPLVGGETIHRDPSSWVGISDERALYCHKAIVLSIVCEFANEPCTCTSIDAPASEFILYHITASLPTVVLHP